MKNIWTEINDDIPRYVQNICKKFELVCIKISPLRTALIGKKFALIITVDRFDAVIYYLHMDGKEIKVYLCDNYFAEKFDANDIANGLLSKWEDVLKGEKDWIENYKKSKWFSEYKLPSEEMRKIEQYL